MPPPQQPRALRQREDPPPLSRTPPRSRVSSAPRQHPAKILIALGAVSGPWVSAPHPGARDVPLSQGSPQDTCPSPSPGRWPVCPHALGGPAHSFLPAHSLPFLTGSEQRPLPGPGSRVLGAAPLPPRLQVSSARPRPGRGQTTPPQAQQEGVGALTPGRPVLVPCASLSRHQSIRRGHKTHTLSQHVRGVLPPYWRPLQ